MKCVFCAIQTRLWYEDKYHYTSSLFIEKTEQKCIDLLQLLSVFLFVIIPHL